MHGESVMRTVPPHHRSRISLSSLRRRSCSWIALVVALLLRTLYTEAVTQSLRARYEGGVFRPLERVDLPEGTTVEMSIAPAGWEDRMRALLERVRARVAEVTPED